MEPFSFIKTNVKVIKGGLNHKNTSNEHNFNNKLIVNVFIWHCSCYYLFNYFCFVLFVCVFVITSWWCKYKHAYFCLENLHFNNNNSNNPVLSSVIYLPVSYMWLLTWSKKKHTPFWHSTNHITKNKTSLFHKHNCHSWQFDWDKKIVNPSFKSPF